MRITVRKKFAMTITEMVIATICLFIKIPIQDNWVKIVEVCLRYTCLGFSVKKVIEIWKQ